MTLLIPSNQNRSQNRLYRATTVSIEEIQSRATRIVKGWTFDQRSDRKRLGTAKRDWLLRLIGRSIKNQE